MTISRVVNASQQLEGIINTSFPKPAYKPLAIKIIYALSVHRLTTNGLDVQFGLTAENLKDDLCLHLIMPEQDADFLLGIVKATLRDIMTTVSGQFIICNEANNQYYIDVDKVVDYDEKIKQKASLMADGELNRYFYQVVYSCLEWDKKQYVSGFNIYEHDLNWDSHNIFREGYLFMGLPGERSTAQPERDFYIHIMPPYGNAGSSRQDLEDEVYFYFKSNNEAKETISLYAASCSLADISEGKDKDAYLGKANILRKKLVKYLSENKNTCFDVVYNKERKQLIEILKGRYNRDLTFNDTIDLAASICLDNYFNKIYPDCPVMKTKITRKNMADNARAAFDHFAGRKTQQSTAMLQSFGILDGDKIRPEGSKYASYYIDMVKALSQQGVLNFSDLFEQQGLYWQIDKKFKVWHVFTPIIFLSMVYAGHAVITLKNGETITASTLDKVPKTKVQECLALSNLRKLRTIEILSSAKLSEIESDLASLKVCYDLTPTEMKTNHICPHCHFSLADKSRNVYGQLDNLEDRIDALLAEWTKQLMDTITDPLVQDQKKYLNAQQVKAIDDFVSSGTLPQRVDDFFVKSIQALLKNYEPIVIEVEDLVQKLDELPPLDETTFKAIPCGHYADCQSLSGALQK